MEIFCVESNLVFCHMGMFQIKKKMNDLIMMMALGGEEKERKERKNRKKEKNKGDSRNRLLPPFAGDKSGHLRPRFRYHSLRFLIRFPFI